MAVIFYLQLWGNSENSKKTKHLNKDKIKKQLIESIIINNTIEIGEQNQLAEKVEKPEEAADIIKQYEEILRTKRKGVASVAYYQGKLFKRFKEKEKFEKFAQMVSKLKIHKNIIIFKISIFKLIEKHPKLMKSSAALGFFEELSQRHQANL